MKFEELEAIWATQQAPPRAHAELAELKRSVIPELKRRSRMLGYGIFTLLLGLAVGLLLAIVNYHYAPPRSAIWHWIYTAWEVTFALALLCYALRRIGRHRTLLRQNPDTLRAVTAVSLANLEAEIQEYRTVWSSPLVWLGFIGFPLLNSYLKFPVTEYGWRPFALRVGVILGLPLLVSWAFRRHYVVNLKPAHARQQELLRQLDETPPAPQRFDSTH